MLAGGLQAAVFSLVIVMGATAMWSRSDDVFLPGGNIAFLDPDCYSRMTRVAMLMEGDGPSIRFHKFENAPAGVEPHTTMPVDWLIVGLAKLIGLTGVAGPVDVAGALISPVLGVGFLVMMAVWGRGRSFGLAALILVAASPLLAHGFSVGRPDHQSLVIWLCAAGMICELAIWLGSRRAGWWAAMVWGLACWVSLFEPMVLLAGCLLLRLVVLGKQALPVGRTWWAAGIFLSLLGAAFAVDGWRNPMPSESTSHYFAAWAASIGELQGVGWSEIAGWSGWLGVVMPAALLVVAVWKKDRFLLACGFFMVGLLVLTLSAARWGYFFVVASALILPVFLPLLRWKAAGWLVFLGSLWPVAAAWERQLYPDREEMLKTAEQRAESLLLLEVAGQMDSRVNGTVLAPWWLSPALAYWSGLPAVAGSSHQSLPGTVDSARIFLSQDDHTANELLQEREVAYIVADDPNRVITNSEGLLGEKSRPHPLVGRLYRGETPTGWELFFSNRFFRIYRRIRVADQQSSVPDRALPGAVIDTQVTEDQAENQSLGTN
ncbi:MAG: hypothetical protein Fur0032_04700 [Terrimicrobiaceae bacterium]